MKDSRITANNNKEGGRDGRPRQAARPALRTGKSRSKTKTKTKTETKTETETETETDSALLVSNRAVTRTISMRL